MSSATEQKIKWSEIGSLIALSVSIAISWIAYHEYQPHLLEKFNFGDLATFLIISKGIILVITPPLAGWAADLLIKKTGNFFLVFSIGIGATAMIFMTVASIIGVDSLIRIKSLLPYLIILWLVGMNVFVSPAISMLDSFAPKEKLPVVVAVLFLATELIYALEPLVINLVNFFGATMTFIVGGILIAGTGYIFQKVSADEVQERRLSTKGQIKVVSGNDYLIILLIGLVLGIGKASLVEYIPFVTENTLEDSSELGSYISFGLLGFSAVLAFIMGGKVNKIGLTLVIKASAALILIATVILFQGQTLGVVTTAGVLIAIGFSFLNVSGLPYAIGKLSTKHITLGIGVYLGATEIAGGIFEYIFQ